MRPEHKAKTETTECETEIETETETKKLVTTSHSNRLFVS